MKNNKQIVLILTIGVFSIINTEMGVTGILPLIAEKYGITISIAGLLVSLFALVVAISGPTMPLLFSGVNRKTVMILALGAFTVCNIVSAFTTSFPVLLIARVLPAFLHPVYVSMAMSVAGASVEKAEAPQAIAKVMMGVSAGMVLGVPIVSFISRTTTLQIGMLFFAGVSALSLIATIICIPSMKVEHRMSYGSQLSILKRANVWISFFGVMCLNGSIFGIYSYLSEYMEKVTNLSGTWISVLLLIYGLANIVGNYIAGKLLSSRPIQLVFTFPLAMGLLYILLNFLGSFSMPMIMLTLVWGVMAGIAANIHQYWMESAAPEAPDFSNGLFLAATNLGTTVATTVCGFVIAQFGISYLILGGLLFLIFAIVLLNMRIQLFEKNVK